MGCCFTKSTTQNHNSENQTAPKTQQPHEPPLILEEESVKEVLSETPIHKPHQVPILMPETKTQMPFLHNLLEKFPEKAAKDQVSEALSQLSETCSISESFSTATTTTAATVREKRSEEDEATSKRSFRDGTTNHRWDRSPSRKRPHAGDGHVAGVRERRVKSPARKPEPPPEKKTNSGSRVVRGRGSGPAANRRVSTGPAALRRDAGEGSGRRSRSPSCGRTSKTGACGGQKQVPPASCEKENEEERSGSEEAVEKNDVVSTEECFENPHVSMECFIFL